MDRYIFNIFPLPHVLILVLFLTITLRIGFNFHFHYQFRPILTLCVVSSLLGSVSDTLAQMIEVIQARRKIATKARETGISGDIELGSCGTDLWIRFPSINTIHGLWILLFSYCCIAIKNSDIT